MSTRANVIIHWNEWTMDVKLYHHRDWYVDYLWVELEKALEKRRKKLNKAMKNWHFWWNPTLIQCVADVGWFEQARPLHWDTEYLYHIYYDIVDRKARYELFCQSWHKFWDENLMKEKKVLLSMNGYKKSMNKKLNPKQAEIELGNREKFIPEYFNS